MLLMEANVTPRERREQAGDWIRVAREAAGLTQTQLGRALGVRNATVSAYETGKSGIGEDRVPALARALRKGVVETRRALGMYVEEGAEDTPAAPVSVLEAILADPDLRDDFKSHISNQYLILREATLATRETTAEMLGRKLEEQARSEARTSHERGEAERPTDH